MSARYVPCACTAENHPRRVNKGRCASECVANHRTGWCFMCEEQCVPLWRAAWWAITGRRAHLRYGNPLRRMFRRRWIYRLRSWLEHNYRELRGRGRPLWLYVNGYDQVVARSAWEAHRIVVWDAGLDDEDVAPFERCAPDRIFKVSDEDEPDAPPESMTPADIVRECGAPFYWWSTEW